jgi:hypothetical protein
MPRRRTIKYLGLAVGCGFILIVAIGVFAVRQFATHRINIPSGAFEDVKSRADASVASARAGEIPWRRVDHSGVGHPQTESELLDLREGINAFELTQHHSPDSISEVINSSDQSPVHHELKTLAKRCQMIVTGSSSFLLNCDGWVAPEGDALKSVLSSFDPHTERFYELGDHVVLYIPPLSTGKPPAPVAKLN